MDEREEEEEQENEWKVEWGGLVSGGGGREGEGGK